MTIQSFFFSGDNNFHFQRGLDPGQEIRVRHTQDLPGGVRQCAACALLRGGDYRSAGGERDPR